MDKKVKGIMTCTFCGASATAGKEIRHAFDCLLFEPKPDEPELDESRLLTKEERMDVDIPCETKCLCVVPKFDSKCMDCIAICHEKAQLAKDTEWEENWQMTRPHLNALS